MYLAFAVIHGEPAEMTEMERSGIEVVLAIADITWQAKICTKKCKKEAQIAPYWLKELQNEYAELLDEKKKNMAGDKLCFQKFYEAVDTLEVLEKYGLPSKITEDRADDHRFYLKPDGGTGYKAILIVVL